MVALLVFGLFIAMFCTTGYLEEHDMEGKRMVNRLAKKSLRMERKRAIHRGRRYTKCGWYPTR